MVAIKSHFSKVTENSDTLLGNLHEEKDEEKDITTKCPEKQDNIFICIASKGNGGLMENRKGKKYM